MSSQQNIFAPSLRFQPPPQYNERGKEFCWWRPQQWEIIFTLLQAAVHQGGSQHQLMLCRQTLFILDPKVFKDAKNARLNLGN